MLQIKANIKYVRVWSQERFIIEKTQLEKIGVPYDFHKSVLREFGIQASFMSRHRRRGKAMSG